MSWSSSTWDAGILTPTSDQTMSVPALHPGGGHPTVPQPDAIPHPKDPPPDDPTSALRDMISKPPTATPEEFVIVNGVKYIREGTGAASVAPSIMSNQHATSRLQADEALNLSQAHKSSEHALASEPIKVTFNDNPTVFYVQRKILLRLLGSQAVHLFGDQLEKKELCLEDVSPMAVSTLIRAFYSAEHNADNLDLSGQSLTQVLDLYTAATRYGHHEWIRQACLDAMAPRRYSLDQLSVTFGMLYDRGTADTGIRELLKAQLRSMLELGSLGVVPGMSMNLRGDLVAATRRGGDLAEDVAEVLFDHGTTKTSQHGWHAHQQASSVGELDRGWQMPIRQPYMPPTDADGLPARFNDLQVNKIAESVGALTPRPRPRSGWVETAPPSEAGSIEREESKLRRSDNYDCTHWGWDNNLAGAHAENASDGGAMLGPATDWLHPNEWEHAGPTSIGLKRARSASELANDCWSLNTHGRDSSWIAPADSWDVPTNAQKSQALPHANYGPTIPLAGAPQPHEPHVWPQLPPTSPTPLPSYAAHPAADRPPAALPASAHGACPARSVYNDPIAASHHQRELNPPPFPMAPPTVFPHPGEGPIGMPHHIPCYGYNRFASVGNGMIYPTSPGLYGLAGRTMVATHDSGFDCTLYFHAGDVISNVIALYPTDVLPYQAASANHSGLITHMQGISRGRAGQFPTTYVREMNPPVFRNLGTPFDPIPTPARNETTAVSKAPLARTKDQGCGQNHQKHGSCANWGCGRDVCKDCRGDEIVVSRTRRVSEETTDSAWDTQRAEVLGRSSTEPAYEDEPKHVTWGDNDNTTGYRSAAEEW